MDIKGTWRVAAIPSFTDEGEFKYIELEEAIKQNLVDDDIKLMTEADFVFTDDAMKIQVVLTGEQKKEALEEGLPCVGGDVFEVDGCPIIKKGKKYYYEFGEDGDGKPHLEPLEFEGDRLAYMLFQLKKVK